jgi:hypothetical protein
MHPKTSLSLFSLACLFLAVIPAGAQSLKDATQAATGLVQTITNGSGASVTNDEVIKGLREALTKGSQASIQKASVVNGFYKNNTIKIPFPKEAESMQKALAAVGMKPQTEKFVETLNRAAERAVKDAAPIFVKAITAMTLTDGISILKGNTGAATAYLRSKTNIQLKAQFLPVVRNALKEVQITRYWTPLSDKYNRLPFVQPVNPNLDDYVTQRALEGLFKLLEQEERNIRKNPSARTSDLLKKVFG